jgi:hypothetical protein
MATDTDMKIDYSLVLKQLQRELDGLDEKRQALLASVEAIRRLLKADSSDELYVPRGGIAGSHPTEVKMPTIPPDFFKGKSPTNAYRDLMQIWPGHYTPPQIADLFERGGMETANRTALVQAIHSVLKRERARARLEQAKRSVPRGASLLDFVPEN